VILTALLESLESGTTTSIAGVSITSVGTEMGISLLTAESIPEASLHTQLTRSTTPGSKALISIVVVGN
jgi:hypothetical protein